MPACGALSTDGAGADVLEDAGSVSVLFVVCSFEISASRSGGHREVRMDKGTCRSNVRHSSMIWSGGSRARYVRLRRASSSAASEDVAVGRGASAAFTPIAPLESLEDALLPDSFCNGCGGRRGSEKEPAASMEVCCIATAQFWKKIFSHPDAGAPPFVTNCNE